MAFNLKDITKNKPAMIGIAGAAGVGLFVYLKNRGQSTSAAAGGATAGSGTVQPTADTTGTDLASWLSQYGQEQNAALSSYQSQLTDTLSALQNAQTTTGNAGATSGGSTSSPVVHPGPIPYVGSGGSTVQLKPGTPGIFESAAKGLTLRKLAGQTHLTVAQLRTINPTLAHTGFDTPIQTGKIIRVK